MAKDDKKKLKLAKKYAKKGYTYLCICEELGIRYKTFLQWWRQNKIKRK